MANHAHSHPHTPAQHEAPDAWHTHSAEEGQPQQEHAATANPLVLFGVFVAMVISVAVVVGLMVVYYHNFNSQHRQRVIEITDWNANYKAYRAQEDARLSTFGWQDAATGAVRIPIDQAKERVIQRYQNKASQADAK